MMGGSPSCRWTRARRFGLTRQDSRSRVPRRWRAAKWWSAVTMATCIALARGSEMHGWGGPGFGFYPPAPYGDGGDSDVVCGPYGCYWNEATAYIPKAIIADNGW